MINTIVELDKSWDESDPHVLAILPVLYGREEWLKARAGNISSSDMENLRSTDRYTGRPFVHLLDAAGDGCDKESHMFAKKFQTTSDLLSYGRKLASLQQL